MSLFLHGSLQHELFKPGSLAEFIKQPTVCHIEESWRLNCILCILVELGNPETAEGILLDLEFWYVLV